jgi:ATP-dependent Lhr-like helicase
VRPHRWMAGRPEGRWSRQGGVGTGGDGESRLLAWVGGLLDRYGVVTREVVALEPAAPAWAELAPILSRSEWRGELRRGFFVEGLSGVQYATEEAAAELARLAAAGPPDLSTPLVLVCTTDPANLYGAGAPLDVELLEGGVARLPRLPGNFVVLRAGRPVVIIESFGKRLTGLASARAIDIDSALNLLPAFAGPDRRILKVESYNGVAAAQSVAAARLSQLGFVRDYPGMAYYAGWPADSTGS